MLTLQPGHFFGTVSARISKPGLTCCITTYNPDDTEADTPHFHDHAQLYLTTRGGSLEYRSGKVTELRPGQTRFYHAGEWHQNIRKGTIREGLNVELDDSFLRAYGLTGVPDEAAARSASLKLSLLAVYRDMVVADPETPESVVSLLLSGLTGIGAAGPGTPRWAAIVRELLHDRWNEQVTLNELSAASGVSAITISKHFPRYFGCTFGEYRRRLKTARALEMVASNNYPLSEIAYACGFADQSHFIRVFRAYAGRPPGEWFTLSV